MSYWLYSFTTTLVCFKLRYFNLDFNVYIVGIDVNQLKFELCSGIRLPDPKFCPETIKSLLHACFYADPYERPNFKQIQEYLQESFARLMTTKSTNESEKINTSPINELKDDTMKTRYLCMIAGNQNRLRNDSLNSKYGTLIDFDSPNSDLKYLSLEDVNDAGEKHNN